MKLLCLFKPCDWQFLTNVVESIEVDGDSKLTNLSYWKTGLYQCLRCKVGRVDKDDEQEES